jgi:hypothetical protein
MQTSSRKMITFISEQFLFHFVLFYICLFHPLYTFFHILNADIK